MGSGQGTQLFHTSTFKTHLSALGWEGSHLEHCPFVHDWIERLFNLDCPQQLFLSLAAVEYFYAVISETITETLAKHDLLCEQHHYEKHSELDWEHGRELLEAMVHAGHEFDKDVFDHAQQDFLHLFDSLAFPTLKEMEMLRQTQPIAFYHTREDQGVLDEALELVRETRSSCTFHSNESRSLDKLSVLLTCSGGEHVLHCLARSELISSITALDVNPKQIELCQEKLENLKTSYDLNFKDVPLSHQQSALGRFEFLFSWIRQYLTRLEGNGHRSSWLSSVTDAHLKYIVGRVFSNDVLEAVFTKDATMYTTASFADHFVTVLQSLLRELDHSPMARNIFLGEPFPYPAEIRSALRDQRVRVQYICSHIQEFDFGSGYDLIDLSNVGDWLPLESFREIVQRAVAALTPGGTLILRRLLGDYDLVSDVLKPCTSSLCSIRHVDDRTHFYSQTVIAAKSSAPQVALPAKL